MDAPSYLGTSYLIDLALPSYYLFCNFISLEEKIIIEKTMALLSLIIRRAIVPSSRLIAPIGTKVSIGIS